MARTPGWSGTSSWSASLSACLGLRSPTTSSISPSLAPESGYLRGVRGLVVFLGDCDGGHASAELRLLDALEDVVSSLEHGLVSVLIKWHICDLTSYLDW